MIQLVEVVYIELVTHLSKPLNILQFIYSIYSQYPNVTSYSSGWIKPLLSQGLPVLGLAVDGTTFISADSTTSNTYYIANHAPI